MKIMLLVIAMLLASMADQTLSPAEREHAVAELESSQKAFLEATNGLSEGQWNFKPAPDRWSIAECAEHIGVTETLVLNLITAKALKGPGDPEVRSISTSPSNRRALLLTTEPCLPSGSWRTGGDLPCRLPWRSLVFCWGRGPGTPRVKRHSSTGRFFCLQIGRGLSLGCCRLTSDS